MFVIACVCLCMFVYDHWFQSKYAFGHTHIYTCSSKHVVSNEAKDPLCCSFSSFLSLSLLLVIIYKKDFCFVFIWNSRKLISDFFFRPKKNIDCSVHGWLAQSLYMFGGCIEKKRNNNNNNNYNNNNDKKKKKKENKRFIL